MDFFSYGRDFDISKPFFDQFEELSKAVPRMSLLNPVNENSSYCNFADWNKNCYLLFNSNSNQESFCSYILLESMKCADCLWTQNSEFCYECTDVEKSHHLLFSRECSGCSDSQFLFECRSCTQCIGCVNLRQKKFHIFNKPVTEEEFKEKELSLQTYSGIRKFSDEFHTFLLQQPHVNLHLLQNENCTGERIVRCNNAKNCYDGYDSEDCSYCDTFIQCKTTTDCHASVKSEKCYENTSLIGYHSCFTAFCRYPENLFYSWDCHHLKNSLGCIGIRDKEFCILNKQYTKEEYEELVPKIIEHMSQTGEWGEFFPASMSPFAYNETVAQEYFPMTIEEVEAKGWKWREEIDEIPKVEKIIPAERLPDSIDDIPDDVLNWAIKCEATERPFRIIKQELDFYRKMKLPIPHFHPDERHRRRMALRNPRKLWKRKCMKCEKEIETTYSPERPEIVYCEECYLKEVY